MLSRSRTGRKGGGIRRLWLVSIVLAFIAATGLVLGTAGFASVNVDRGVSVDVVSDDDGYLSFNQTNDRLVEGERTEIIEYRNQFTEDVEFETVTVTAKTGETEVEVREKPGDSGAEDQSELSVGERGALEAKITDFESAEEVTLHIEVRAAGDSVEVEKERTVSVTREYTADDFDIEFIGEGSRQVEITGPDAGFPLTVNVTTRQGNSTTVAVCDPGKIDRDEINGSIDDVEIKELSADC